MLVQRVMFDTIFFQAFDVWFTEDTGIFLLDLILNPIKAHVHGFWSFLAHCIVCNSVYGRTVSLHGCC